MQAGSLYVASGMFGVDNEAVPHFPDFTTEFTATPLETTSSRFEQIETCYGRPRGVGMALDTRHASVFNEYSSTRHPYMLSVRYPHFKNTRIRIDAAQHTHSSRTRGGTSLTQHALLHAQPRRQTKPISAIRSAINNPTHPRTETATDAN